MITNDNNKKHYGFIALRFTLFAAIVSLLVMKLWNAILPDLIPGIGTLTYLKAVGLLVLSKILFSGFPQKHGPNRSNKSNYNMMNMTPEEREKIKSEWKNRCNQ